MAYTDLDPRHNRRGTLRFPPQLEMRPSSIIPNPVESREAPPNSRVFLTFHRHPEKLPEVTVTSRGNTGFPAAPRERPRDSPFNASGGPINLLRLENNAVLPLLTRMDTELPWGPTRGSLSSPPLLERNPTCPTAAQNKQTNKQSARFPCHCEMRPFFSCRA